MSSKLESGVCCRLQVAPSGESYEGKRRPGRKQRQTTVGIWRDSLHVTCGLTACTPGSTPGPTLGNEYGKTLLYLLRRWAGTRKVKPILILLKRQWVASAGPHASLHLNPDNHASTPPLRFLQAGCPSCRPTNSIKALKANRTYSGTGTERQSYLANNCFLVKDAVSLQALANWIAGVK